MLSAHNNLLCLFFFLARSFRIFNREYEVGYDENDVVEKSLVVNTLVNNYNTIYLDHVKCITCNRKNMTIILFYLDYFSK